MSTPYIIGRGSRDSWQGIYVHHDGDTWSVHPVLEAAFVERSGDLESVLEQVFSAPLGWRSLFTEAYESDDLQQAEWIGRVGEASPLTPADPVTRGHVVYWYIVDVERRLLHVIAPDDTLEFSLQIDERGQLEPLPVDQRRPPPPPPPPPPFDLSIATLRRLTGADEERTLALVGLFLETHRPGLELEVYDADVDGRPGIELVQFRKVVETVQDPILEVSLTEARELDSEIGVNDDLGQFLRASTLEAMGICDWLMERASTKRAKNCG